MARVMKPLRWILLAQWVLSAVALAGQGSMPPLPPITSPPTEKHLPGKFVWADLFSSDVEKSRKFYEQVFGWEWEAIGHSPEPYGIFYLGDMPVAGLAYRTAPDGGGAYGRWIHYISVANVGATEIAVEQRGGRSILENRSFEERGDFAIVSDLESAPFGIMRSSSGDPGDYRAEPGEWIWREYFTRDLWKAIKFYTGLFAYESQKDELLPEVMDYVLKSHGHLRAGVGALPSDSEASPTWLGYVRVKDIDAALTQIKALGGTVILEPSADTADGGLAIAIDPTGAKFGLLRWDYGDAESGDTGSKEMRP